MNENPQLALAVLGVVGSCIAALISGYLLFVIRTRRAAETALRLKDEKLGKEISNTRVVVGWMCGKLGWDSPDYHDEE